MVERLKKWYTLRNQILVVFLAVMIIVLAMVSFITLKQVSSLVKKNAENQIEQTAVEAGGRIDSLFKQLNTATKIILTNQSIQSVLEKKYVGEGIAFSELQRITNIMNTMLANSEGIYSIDLYASNLDRLVPFDDTKLFDHIDRKWIEQADEAGGKLVWIGEDPQNPNYFLLIRRVNLMERRFANGGYLLIRINSRYLQVADQNIQEQYTILLDKELNPIFTNYPGKITPDSLKNQSTIMIHQKEYIVTKQTSDETGFTVLILTPVRVLTERLSSIRIGIMISGIIGIIIYLISSWFLSTSITKPIVKLTNTMRLANEGLMALNPQVITVNEINELNSTYNQLVKETNHLIKMVYQKEIIRSHSELKALQAQINPHFLYNTLDSLRWSLEEKGEEELADIVVSMSNLFRYTISKNAKDDWATVKEEFDHIQNYLEIIRFRFGDRIKWKLMLPPTLESAKIPKLLIQPLVENAVIHGSGNQLKPCTIIVSVQSDSSNENMRITVEDDGAGMDEEKLNSIKNLLETGGLSTVNGKGIALYTIKKRLQYYYKEESEKFFSITSQVNQGTKITIEVPINGGDL
ncbi:Two-component sensor histidine kinase [[Clostridium] ultunense Esp]|nr:Two-component sensor histidine kinase [[Clostridium] ultunense Esp]